MPQTLYVTDLDGTLLNNGSIVSPESDAILADLTADGAMITVATARTPATVVPLMEGSGLFLPYIVLTGAALYHPREHRYSDVRFIPEADAAWLREAYAEAGIAPFTYYLGRDDTLVVHHNPGMTIPEREFYEQRANLTLKRFTYDPLPYPDSRVILLFSIGPREYVLPLAEKVEADGRFACSFYPDIFHPGLMLLEVFAAGVSKADAMKRLADNLGCRRIVAYGDNLNDLPMLREATRSVAVSNAQGAVKAEVDVVIGPNYDNAVAHDMAADFYDSQ